MIRECFSCKHYIYFEGEAELIEICCKHKIRIVAEQEHCCRGWEYDDLYDNDAMDRTEQKDHIDLYPKE